MVVNYAWTRLRFDLLLLSEFGDYTVYLDKFIKIGKINFLNRLKKHKLLNVGWTLAWREILGLAQVDGTGLASLDEISPTVIPVVARKNAPDWVSSGSRIEGLWQVIEIGIYFLPYLGVSFDFSLQCSCW